MRVGLVVLFVLMVICAFKESSVTGRYKANKVYGRVKAYLALDLTLVGIVGVLSLVIPAWKDLEFPVPISIGCLVIGLLLYVVTFLKCPEPLKAMCIPCMLLSGAGVAVKIALFFLPFVWKLTTPAPVSNPGIPEVIQDSDGNNCRTRIDGEWVYVTRPGGGEVSTRLEYVDLKTRGMDIDGIRFHWQ